MDESTLRERVDAPVRVVESAPNTSDWVRRRGRDGAPEGTFAVANELTAAVGRSGDAWSAPPGGVWCSTLLRPDIDAGSVGRITLTGGLAVCAICRSRGVDARLKWPNDVVVPRDGRPAKLAGVLTEAVVDDVPVAGKPVEAAPGEGGDLQFVVCGVGLNADLAPDLDADRPVTTLRAECDEVDRFGVAVDLHAALLDLTDAVGTEAGFADLLDEYRERSATLGEEVRVRRSDGDVVGKAVDVTATGALVVETADGRETVSEGECERLRRRD